MHRNTRFQPSRTWLAGLVLAILLAGPAIGDINRLVEPPGAASQGVQAKNAWPGATYNKVLFLGNSITLHPPLPEFGWAGNWGMAATAAEKDYAHTVIRGIAEATGFRPGAMIVNIADFERQHRTYDIAEKLKAPFEYKADLVILAIAENVELLRTDESRTSFKKSVLKLLQALKAGSNPTILVRSCYWPDSAKDDILMQVCQEIGGIFVNISGLNRDNSTHAVFERKFTDSEVGRHPGDKGMQAIADAMVAALRKAGKQSAPPSEAPKATATIHPAPGEEVPATDYQVTVDGQPVFTYAARVSANPINQVWPGYQRPLAQTEIASFATWDMAVPVEVKIVSARPIQEVQVQPKSAGIQPRIEGNTIRFAVSKPGQIVVAVNGRHQALHLFANPPEPGAPDSRDPTVRFFGPGVHCPGLIRLQSNQTLYLAGGAVVYGAVLAEKADNIIIRGRGILDGSKVNRLDATGLLTLFGCNNVSIEGITIRDSCGFTMPILASRQVYVSNVKIIGNWRYNTDGMNFINCQHCSVEDSFVRTFDDTICIKGYQKFGSFIYSLMMGEGEKYTIDGVTSHRFAEFQALLGVYPCEGASISDFRVRRCVLWNDWGAALEIGVECVADEIHDVVYEDSDIIHASSTALDIQVCDRALCHDVLYRDIRVELDGDNPRYVFQQRKDQVYVATPNDRYTPGLINLSIHKSPVSYDPELGRIEDIRFQDIKVTSSEMPSLQFNGHDAAHLVQRVSIENLTVNGQRLTSLPAGSGSKNEFARDITLDGRPISK